MEQLIVLAIFFIIWFIGWIGNLGKAKQPPVQPGRPAQPVAPADEKLKAEIERFLQEVGVKPAEQQKPPAPVEPVVVVSEQPRRPPMEAKRVPKKAAQPAKKKSVQPQSSSQSRSLSAPMSSPSTTFSARPNDLANKHLAPSSVGEAFRDQHLKSNLPAAMQEYLSRRQKGQTHDDAASSLRAQMSPEEIARAAILFQEQRFGKTVRYMNADLLSFLKSPQSIRQAIVVSEILKRPNRTTHS